ncbi:glycine zipper 2TM domain-containing protein [Flaviaesturariibacter terrae]
MKQIFSAITAAAFLVACNSAPTPTATTTTTTTTVAPDTSGFAQFQAWKAQSELSNPNANNTAVATAPAASNTRSYAPVRRSSSSSAGRRSSSSSSGSMSSSSSSTAQAPARKGWSKAAKGAVIGGVAGAAAGAVINKKNRAAGAVIGGILGAAGGYGIGRAGDKKDGRY